MDFSFQGKNVHASTGGVDFDASKPVVVFLHGAGMDHTVWFLQSRWFAYRGRGVLALPARRALRSLPGALALPPRMLP